MKKIVSLKYFIMAMLSFAMNSSIHAEGLSNSYTCHKNNLYTFQETSQDTISGLVNYKTALKYMERYGLRPIPIGDKGCDITKNVYKVNVKES